MTTIATYPTTGQALTVEATTWTNADDEDERGIIIRQGDQEVWLSTVELAAIVATAYRTESEV